MSFNISQSFFGHLAFTGIAEFAGSVGQGKPVGAANFMSHSLGNVIDLARLIFSKKERYDLERLFIAGPFAHIYVLDVAEFGDERSCQAGFFMDFTESGLRGLF